MLILCVEGKSKKDFLVILRENINQQLNSNLQVPNARINLYPKEEYQSLSDETLIRWRSGSILLFI